MKYHSIHQLAPRMATAGMMAAVLAMANTPASADGLFGHGRHNHKVGSHELQTEGDEVVVGEPVVTDTVISSTASSDSAYASDGTYAADGTYIDGAAVNGNPIEGTFVGDLSSEQAGFAGGCRPRQYGKPDLFYNFYTQGNCNAANAQMYLSPLPVPPNVGHTFFTYQPFYPHEMMYWHKNRFHRYYDNGRGMNRTRAVYYSPPIKQAASNIYWNYLRLPR